jgi:hypothetical protein
MTGGRAQSSSCSYAIVLVLVVVLVLEKRLMPSAVSNAGFDSLPRPGGEPLAGWLLCR